MRRVRIPTLLLVGMMIGGAPLGPATAVARAADVAKPTTLTEELRRTIKGRIKKVYAERGYRPLWVEGGNVGPEAQALVRYLSSASLDGLRPSSYDLDDVQRALSDAKSGDPRALAAAEATLSEAFVRYAGDMRRPTNVNMTYLDKRLRPKKMKADAVLRAAALSRDFGDYITNMGWMSPHYVNMRGLLAKAEIAGSDDATLRRLRLNLERTRILPGPWTHHIVVDAASGRLWYYQAGRQEGTMRVIVGKPASQTPMLAGMLQYAILNPYWNVPVDLAQTLVAPKVLAGRSLKSMGFEALSDWSETPAKLKSSSINWPAVAAGDQEIRVRQLPGGTNSMGRVKFMFPNDYGIFLHDTPERALFEKSARHFSNGCVRLEDAPRLGKWLLGTNIRSSSKAAAERPVALKIPVPVYLTYMTATPTKTGVGFLKDVYGRDGG